MQDVFATTILPISQVLGILASALVSIVLVVTSFSRVRANSSVFSRLAKIEAELKKDAQKVELQIVRSSQADPARACNLVADLALIATELQHRTEEAQSILDDLRTANRANGTVETTKKIAELDIGVGEAGNHVRRLLQRLENKQQQLSEANSPNAIG